MVQALAAAEVAKSAGKSKATPYIVGGVIITVTVLAVFIVIKVMEATGLKDTRKEKKDAKASEKLNSDEAFNPVHSRNKPSRVTISNKKAEKLAKDIYLSSGHVRAQLELSSFVNPFGLAGYTYDDDEAKLKGAIRDSGTTYNLSKVSDVFFKKYRLGMLDHVQSFTNESERAIIKDVVDNFKS